ncbi:MAG: cytochrome c oxidase subunit 3 [Acidimicrobiales bacterium]|jgi:cytochrome c oxidase subunit 3|nr:cytochrome c oxidase subunit 3 [Acidimicrobiales bacterium]
MVAVTRSLPPAPPVQRPRVLMVGTAFTVAAATMALLALLAIYLTERSAVLAVGDTWLPDGVVIPLSQPNIMMATLLMGVISVQWAVYAIARDDRVNAYLALGLTLVFGIMVVVMTSYLYSIMGLDVAANPQSVLIYAVTGGHLVFLIATMVFLALMAIRALGGQFTSRQHDGISAAALAWHVQTAVFFVIWLAIYITK